VSLRAFLPEYMAKRVLKRVRVDSDNVYMVLEQLCSMGDYELASYIASGLAGGREPTNNFWIIPPSSRIKTCYTLDARNGRWLVVVFGFEVEGSTDYSCIVIEFDERSRSAEVGIVVRPCSMREYSEYVSEEAQAEARERIALRAETLPLKEEAVEGEDRRRRVRKRVAEQV